MNPKPDRAKLDELADLLALYRDRAMGQSVELAATEPLRSEQRFNDAAVYEDVEQMFRRVPSVTQAKIQLSNRRMDRTDDSGATAWFSIGTAMKGL